MNIFNELKYKQSGDFGGLIRQDKKWWAVSKDIIAGVILTIGLVGLMILGSCL